jgi:hypothetical protein
MVRDGRPGAEKNCGLASTATLTISNEASASERYHEEAGKPAMNKPTRT